MNVLEFLVWTASAAGLVLIVTSIVLVFRPQLPPVLRYGPVGITAVYFSLGLIQYFVVGVSAVVIIPLACFALYLGVRVLWHRSPVAYIFAVSTFLFWPTLLLACCNYLFALGLTR